MLSFLFTISLACSIRSSDKDQDGFSAKDDCNDNDPLIHPAADEICDGIDNDCDKLIDDEDEVSTVVDNVLYIDNDGDGYGDIYNAVGYCDEPPTQEEYIAMGSDCNDNDPLINPDGQEICDELDNDCDELIDEQDDSLDITSGTVFYLDLDSDYYGDPNNSVLACTQPDFHTDNAGDCDDWNFQRNPGKEEDCDDDIDNDCDYAIDRFDSYCIGQEPLTITSTFMGTQIDADAGYSVSTAGDVNGDQWPDMLIGSPGVGYDTGEVYLYISYPLITSGSLYDATHVFRGAHSFSRAGSAVGLAGDTDGDGRDDILIGADQTGLHEGLDVGYGAAYLFQGVNILAGKPRGLEEATIQIRGDNGDFFGNNLSGVGDINGDGFDDYLISAPGNEALETDNKGVYLFYGGQEYAHSSEAPHHFILDPTPEGRHELTAVNDINGDGFDDILIGAAAASGDAHLFWGGTLPIGDISPQEADLSLLPEGVSDEAHQIASIGDLDNDGLGDIMIGAPKNDGAGNNAGRSYLLLGKDLPHSGSFELKTANYQFHGAHAGDQAGYVFDAGDLNKDEKKDLLIGAPGFNGQYRDQGKLYTIIVDFHLTMENQNIETAASQSIVGEYKNDRLGTNVAYIGDVNRDSKPSVLLGRPEANTYRDNTGEAQLISLRFEECFDCQEICGDGIDNDNNDFIDCYDPTCSEQAECTASEVCNDEIDNDADGGIDCIDPDCNRNPLCGVNMGAELLGEHANARAGWSIVNAGDVDGDGLQDVLIGAPNRTEGHGNNGKIYLMYGATLLSTGTISLQAADFHFLGEEAGDLAGWALSSLGDLDNDGLGDIMISAPLNNTNGENSGKVYVFLGASIQNGSYAIPMNLADYIFVGDHAFAYLGKDLDGNFDINGDGNDDIVLSSRGFSQWGQPNAIAHVVQLNSLPPGTYTISDVSRQMYSDPMSDDDLLHDAYVDAIGDIDGDGLDDIALGARGTIYPFYESGGVYIAYASTISASMNFLPDIHIHGDEAGYKIGYVHSAGDIDKDGLADILIGRENDGEYKSYIYNANRLGIGSKGVLHADYSFDSTGERFAVLPDVDGDGYSDYLFHGEEDVYLVYGSLFPHYGDIDFSWDEASYTFADKGGYFGNFGSVGDIDGDGLSDIFLVNLQYNSEQGHIQWALY